MSTLIVGFDSAWTSKNSGAITGLLRFEDGGFHELGYPITANYSEASVIINRWQAEKNPAATVIMLDQPTIVRNATGQRPVENLVGAPISLRYGGVQPANTSKKEMFGKDAPLWPFLKEFGESTNPLSPLGETLTIETYPVLAMVAMGWTLTDERTTGRLPKYNPKRKKTFSLSDWSYVCSKALEKFQTRGLNLSSAWLGSAIRNSSPSKSDQDGLDACVCLLIALHFVERKGCLMVGNLQTGYMVVPYSPALHSELETRCWKTGRVPSEWIHTSAGANIMGKKWT